MKLGLSAQDGSPKTPKSFGETIMTTTPVFLTVVATLLAGLSSGEMTQAQYYRSLAAQHQAKAGDQWGYFQAKRIRGSILEQTNDLLHPSGQPLAQSLPATLHRLLGQFQRVEKYTGKFLKSLNESKLIVIEYLPSRQNLQQAGEKMLGTIKEKNRAVALLQDKIAGRLKDKEVVQALTYLESESIPDSLTEVSFGNPILPKTLQAIRDRQSDEEIAADLAKIHFHDVQDAIDKGDFQARAFEKKARPTSKAIEELGKYVNQTANFAYGIYRDTQNLANMAETPLADEKDSMTRAISGMVKSATDAKTAADELKVDYKVNRNGYKARCYEREARQNQVVAELYELTVRLHGLFSDRHRHRSKNFFYGMLAAQTGVTISSLSLAVRRKSILWGLASLVGLGAVFFGGYVYLCM